MSKKIKYRYNIEIPRRSIIVMEEAIRATFRVLGQLFAKQASKQASKQA